CDTPLSLSRLVPLALISLFILSPLAAQAALFAPGATLDPGCLPTDPTCGIATSTASVTTGTANQVAYYAVNGNVLSGIATSSLGLLTTNVAEGTNLYFTNARADARVLSLLSATTSLPNITTLSGLTNIGSSFTGILHATAGALTASLVDLTSEVTGVLPPANGGLGSYSLPTPSGDDWFDGDSATAGIGATSCSRTSASPSGTCFSDLVSIHDSAAEVNEAVSGTCLEYTTTAGSPCNQSSSSTGSLIKRYMSDATTLAPGMRVHLMIGNNDAGASANDSQINVATFRANLITVASAFAAIVGSKNVVLGELPMDNASQDPVMQYLFNVTIDQVAMQYGYAVAPTANVLQTCVLSLSYADTCLYSDNTHPDNNGYSYIATAFEIANYGYAVSEYAQNNAQLASSPTLLFGPQLSTLDTAVGYGALLANRSGTGSTGSGNSAFGFSALVSNTSGNGNTAVGANALSTNTTGAGNTAVGFDALHLLTSGGNNTAIGYNALYNVSSGAFNVANGQSALYANSTGSGNTADGQGALGGNTTGIGNTANGYNAGDYIADGSTANQASSYSVYEGASTKALASSDSNEIVIGYAITGLGSNSTAIQSGTAPGFYSGVGAPTFSAPNASQFLRYDGSTGSTLYYNTSGISTSGTKWSSAWQSILKGNIGIGTTSPYSLLTVWGPDTASTTAFAVVNSASTTVFSVRDNGNATYSGSIFQSSDQRLKTNITLLDASSSLSAIEGLVPVSYTRLDQSDSGTNLGFVAQQVQQIFPELVSTTSPTSLTPDGTLTVNYVGLIAPLVKAVQALATQVNAFSQSITTAVLNATTVNSQQENTQKLCVDGTCVTGSQLQQLLQNAGQGSGGGGSGSAAAPAAAGSGSSLTDASTSEPTTPDASSTDAMDSSTAN
ncbi:MAG: tail fiber domain-containing protein, partial [Minisyncoccia bacterium]